jgi:hypothetical protein
MASEIFSSDGSKSMLSTYLTDEWESSFGIGPLNEWSLDGLKDAFKNVAYQLCDRIGELERKLVNWDSSADESGDKWADACQSLEFEEVARTQAFIGLLAPLMETLIHHSTSAFRQQMEALEPKNRITTGTNADNRTAFDEGQFWDACMVYQGRGNDRRFKASKDIVDGFQQILESIGHQSAVPQSSWNLLRALFMFRNRALHRVLWPQKRMVSFNNNIETNGWTRWFSVTTSQVGKAQLTIERIVVQRQFVDDVFIEIERIASALRNALRTNGTFLKR